MYDFRKCFLKTLAGLNVLFSAIPNTQVNRTIVEYKGGYDDDKFFLTHNTRKKRNLSLAHPGLAHHLGHISQRFRSPRSDVSA